MQIFDRPEPPPRRPWRPGLRSALAPALEGLKGSGLARLGRRPLAWIVAAEVVVCGALVVTAWHLIASAAATAAAPAAGALPTIGAAPVTRDSPLPSTLPFASGAAPAVGRPGLATGPAFLGGLLEGLNHDQARYESSEWAALQALSGAIRAYIERVILPAVEKAQQSSRGRSP